MSYPSVKIYKVHICLYIIANHHEWMHIIISPVHDTIITITSISTFQYTKNTHTLILLRAVNACHLEKSECKLPKACRCSTLYVKTSRLVILSLAHTDTLGCYYFYFILFSLQIITKYCVQKRGANTRMGDASTTRRTLSFFLFVFENNPSRYF